MLIHPKENHLLKWHLLPIKNTILYMFVSAVLFGCKSSPTIAITDEIKNKIDSVIISEFKISNPSIADKLLLTIDSHPESSYHITVRVNRLQNDSFKNIYWAYHINKNYEILQALKQQE